MDEDMRSALAVAAHSGEPPARDPVGEVFARAGKVRRRQRVQAAGAGLATVVVLGAGVWLLPSGGQPAQTGQASPQGQQARSPGGAVAVYREGGLTDPQAVMDNLVRLMPPGVTVERKDMFTGFAEIVVADAAGRSTILVNVQPDFGRPGSTKEGDIAAAFDCANRGGVSGATCRAERLPDGSPMIVQEGGRPVAMRMVDALLPGNLRVVVSEYNAIDTKNGPNTRPEPLLSEERMRAIVLDRSWRG